jgi:hypothetical protein
MVEAVVFSFLLLPSFGGYLSAPLFPLTPFLYAIAKNREIPKRGEQIICVKIVSFHVWISLNYGRSHRKINCSSSTLCAMRDLLVFIA